MEHLENLNSFKKYLETIDFQCAKCSFKDHCELYKDSEEYCCLNVPTLSPHIYEKIVTNIRKSKLKKLLEK